MKNQSLKSGVDNSARTNEALDTRDFSLNENADYGAQNADAAKNLDENAQDFSANLASETSEQNLAPCEQNSKDFFSVECRENRKNSSEAKDYKDERNSSQTQCLSSAQNFASEQNFADMQNFSDTSNLASAKDSASTASCAEVCNSCKPVLCSRCKREIVKQNFKLGCVGFGLFALNIAAGALNFLGRLGSVADKKVSEIRARQKAPAN
ncbi:hypothetical protein [uncultured Campylobacter sp.]|uniref:hypothetical protein n=1 Tax=uncultured Campylobacter sp. TaxID=218934 RepID=UPI0015B1D4A0|nr:hypothetical protein [uncultured Campylobacter sp.]